LKTILVAIYHHQRFLDLYNFSKQLQESKKVKVYLYINTQVYARYSEIIANCQFNIILDPCIDIRLDAVKFKNTAAKKSWIPGGLFLSFLKNTSLVQIYRDVKYYRILKKKYDYFQDILKENKIDIVFVTGDRHVHEEPAILKAARDSNIKILLPYLVNYAEYERVLLARSGSSFNIGSTSIYSYFMKNKFAKYLYKGVSYYPFFTMNSIYRFKVLSDNPWIMGCGISDVIFLDSKDTYDRYIGYGVERSKLKIVGDISYDTLYAQYISKDKLSNKILNKYKLNKKYKNIVIALPQLAEHDILSWKDHWVEIDFLVSVACEKGQNVLLSLHPKMDLDKYIFLEEKYNCRILSERLIQVLPVSDMFIATYSSTVIWSTLCGIKTIVVDFYNLNFSIFTHLESITLVKEKEFFSESIDRLINNKVDYESDWKALSRKNVFNGLVIEKYLKMIDKLG
jgi:hypothetical protein